jgi:hypothetical protein
MMSERGLHGIPVTECVRNCTITSCAVLQDWVAAAGDVPHQGYTAV